MRSFIWSLTYVTSLEKVSMSYYYKKKVSVVFTILYFHCWSYYTNKWHCLLRVVIVMESNSHAIIYKLIVNLLSNVIMIFDLWSAMKTNEIPQDTVHTSIENLTWTGNMYGTSTNRNLCIFLILWKNLWTLYTCLSW